MALQLILQSLDGLDEAFKALYTEKDGKFYLDVEGIEDTTGLKSALDSERLIGREAKRQLGELQKKYKNVDLDAYNAMVSQATSDAEAQLIAQGRIDEVVQLRLQPFVDAHNQTVEDLTGENKTLKRSALENQLRSAFGKIEGMHGSAIDDALLLGLNEFSLSPEGKAVKLGSDGNPILGADGKAPFSPGEWVEGQRAVKQHWFVAGNSGSGSEGEGDATHTGKTATRTEFDSLTPEAKMTFSKEGGAVVD